MEDFLDLIQTGRILKRDSQQCDLDLIAAAAEAGIPRSELQCERVILQKGSPISGEPIQTTLVDRAQICLPNPGRGEGEPDVCFEIYQGVEDSSLAAMKVPIGLTPEVRDPETLQRGPLISERDPELHILGETAVAQTFKLDSEELTDFVHLLKSAQLHLASTVQEPYLLKRLARETEFPEVRAVLQEHSNPDVQMSATLPPTTRILQREPGQEQITQIMQPEPTGEEFAAIEDYIRLAREGSYGRRRRPRELSVQSQSPVIKYAHILTVPELKQILHTFHRKRVVHLLKNISPPQLQELAQETDLIDNKILLASVVEDYFSPEKPLPKKYLNDDQITALVTGLQTCPTVGVLTVLNDAGYEITQEMLDCAYGIAFSHRQKHNAAAPSPHFEFSREEYDRMIAQEARKLAETTLSPNVAEALVDMFWEDSAVVQPIAQRTMDLNLIHRLAEHPDWPVRFDAEAALQADNATRLDSILRREYYPITPIDVRSRLLD